MKPYIIIPALNEAARISAVIKASRKYSSNIIVVDDGSRDNTAEAAEKSGASVLKHMVNLGKGAALRTGTDYAVQQGADVVVYIDSDGQHDPHDIPRLLKALKGNDILFTYRKLDSYRMPLVKKFGNAFLGMLMRLLFHIRIRDTQCGYKIMTKKAYQQLGLVSNDYLIESEIVAKTGKHNLAFTQEPIATIYADKYKGTTIFNGISIALRMFWWKLK